MQKAYVVIPSIRTPVKPSATVTSGTPSANSTKVTPREHEGHGGICVPGTKHSPAKTPKKAELPLPRSSATELTPPVTTSPQVIG